MEIFSVILSKQAKRDLGNVPKHIVVKLQSWIDCVSYRGLRETRKIPGYHDEPLRGSREGERSIRLSKSYRAIYIELKKGLIEFINVIEVTKHDY